MNVNALDHVNIITDRLDCPRAFAREVEPGSLTGAIHHVALNCSGYDEVLARISGAGMEFQINTVEAIGLRQIFTADPNNVLLELNFFGD